MCTSCRTVFVPFAVGVPLHVRTPVGISSNVGSSRSRYRGAAGMSVAFC